MSVTNPAERLLDILERARKQRPDAKIRQVWAIALNVPNQDAVKLFRGLAELHQLTDAIEAQIRSLPDINAERHLASFPRLRQALSSMQWDSPWQDVNNLLDEAVIARLEFCSEKLAAYPEELIADEVLKTLLTELNELETLIANTDLTFDLRKVLLDLISTARNAVINYRFQGVTGMRHALAHTIGTLLIAQKLPDAESNKTILEKAFEFAKKFDVIVSAASKCKALIAPVITSLPDS